ncbi:hypothetical protein DMW43_27445, partial [Serratia marcescens]
VRSSKSNDAISSTTVGIMEASITVSHSFQCHPRDALRALCAARGWHWKLWLTVMLASMMPTVVLLIASLLLLDLTPLTTEDGS